MLSIHTFTFNPFQENTYIISNEQRECWIVDPGMSNTAEQNELVRFIDQHQLIPQAIINTHAHIDHILGIDFIAGKYDIPFFLHEKEMPVLNNAGNTARMFGFQYDGVQTSPAYIREGEPFALKDEELQILFVPGHSPGSIAFYYPKGNWVISGDALFSGSIGRTDLLMGDFDTLIHSIRTQLLPLPSETIVYSGHGPATTIEAEKSGNPFLV
ncbi:MAG TPA: MBL fold metallo-hydrolase [Chitinophagaceae bacterium]|nr:MBL fold metallo-hydrolase [Chitinophagaceae bacterium]